MPADSRMQNIFQIFHFNFAIFLAANTNFNVVFVLLNAFTVILLLKVVSNVPAGSCRRKQILSNNTFQVQAKKIRLRLMLLIPLAAFSTGSS